MDYYNYIEYDFFNNSYREDLPWILGMQDKSVQYNLNKAVQIVKDSVLDEAHDATYYEELLKMTNNEEDKKIIESIRQDELLHNRILRYVFTKLTGVILPKGEAEIVENNDNYITRLEKAFTGEVKAAEKYRELLSYMPNKELYNKVLYIMTDEMKHSTLLSYLISKYYGKN